MNSFDILTLAEIALKDFDKHFNGRCFLRIEDGSVVAVHCEKMPPHYPACLIFSANARARGLTSYQWELTGTELLNLYNKEVACQARQKP